MKITNHSGLPEPIVAAVKNDSYNKGGASYSTTELAVPSRIVALKKIHASELTEDAADLIYALIGKLGHSILEQAGTASIIEKRLFWEVGGVTISGQVDVVDESILDDWKFTSTYAAKSGAKPEWISQASVNRYLCEKNGIYISKARYTAIYRDWSKPKVKRERDYPRHQVEVFDVPMWSLEETERWICERIKSHEDAMITLPICTDEERWARGAGVAVMKKGRKTALRVLPSEGAALDYMHEQSDTKNLYTEARHGTNMRCENYCSVMPFCDFAKSLGITPEAPMFSDDEPLF